MGLMSFTKYGDPLLLHTFGLMKDRYAFFQNRGFEQPGVATPGQEVVVLFGGHFNQDFHGEKLILGVVLFKPPHKKFSQICDRPRGINAIS